MREVKIFQNIPEVKAHRLQKVCCEEGGKKEFNVYFYAHMELCQFIDIPFVFSFSVGQ